MAWSFLHRLDAEFKYFFQNSHRFSTSTDRWTVLRNMSSCRTDLRQISNRLDAFQNNTRTARSSRVNNMINEYDIKIA